MINREDLLSGTRPEINNKVLITVMHHFDGYQVMDYKGMVWGISMRVKDMGQDYAMGCKQITGGELTSFTELSDETRQRAVDRMIDMAKRIGANAIINFKFEQKFGGTTDGSEVTAFGNAVVIKPIKNYVPTGGLGNILAEFVDIFAGNPTGQKLSAQNSTGNLTIKNDGTKLQPNVNSEHKINISNQQVALAKLIKENSQLFVVCPSCGMKYGADVTNNSQIRVRNFEDEDINEKGQQIFCIKCGQKFTVPQKNNGE